MTERTCSVDGCEKKLHGGGMCSMHYKRWKRYGDPLMVLHPKAPGATCSVSGCGKAHKGRGLCAAHLRRFRLYGSPLGGGVGPWPGGKCGIATCDREHAAFGLCQMHLQRLRTTGDPLSARPSRRVSCMVCDHPDADHIDELLRSGRSRMSVGAEFGFQQATIQGHAVKHLDNDEWHAKRAAYWVNRLAEVQAAGD